MNDHAAAVEAVRKKHGPYKCQGVGPGNEGNDCEGCILLRAYEAAVGEMADKRRGFWTVCQDHSTLADSSWTDEGCVVCQRDTLRAQHAALVEERGKEIGITWLAAQLLVALVAKDVGRLKEGDFKMGMEFACEEILERMKAGPDAEATSLPTDVLKQKLLATLGGAEGA
jgi:hypothetical protein